MAVKEIYTLTIEDGQTTYHSCFERLTGTSSPTAQACHAEPPKPAVTAIEVDLLVSPAPSAGNVTHHAKTWYL